MKIVFLGSGTSHGVPTIGCNCPVCTSANPKNNRTRASIWIRAEGLSILIDTSTDFRTQALREGIRTLDAILLTHAHADHLHGLDDIRPLCWVKTIPVYANAPTLLEIQRRFAYIFEETQRGGGKPKIELHEINHKTLTIGELEILPIPVKHGKLEILGFRIGKFAYITDCSQILPDVYPLLNGLDVLVLNALRDKPHETHFSVAEALVEIEKIKPGKTYLTHLCHNLEHEELCSRLPGGVLPAYDGLIIDIENDA